MTALKTCTVNFNDLYLKSNIGKVSHYRPGILFDHLICLNISVRLKGAYGKVGIWNPESGIRNPESGTGAGNGNGNGTGTRT